MSIENMTPVEDIAFSLSRNEITETQAIACLEKIKVRGRFDGDRFVGYDYDNQEWVEFTY